MALGELAALGGAASIANTLRGSLSNGGSQQNSASKSVSYGSHWANTAGNLASARSQAYAQIANANSMSNWKTAADYNAAQAQAQRAWQEYMANTQYQRAVEDMKKAGLNPILAASNGIGGAAIGSGAAASMSAPETFMGTSLAEQNSAGTTNSNSESHGQGSSWSHSESGLATGLKLMGEAISAALAAQNSANTFNFTIKGLEKLIGKGDGKLDGNDVTNALTYGTDMVTKGPVRTITGKAKNYMLNKAAEIIFGKKK